MSRKSPEKRQKPEAGPVSVKPPLREPFPSSRHFKWLTTILFVYFGVRLLFYSVTIHPFVPPDEHTHFEISRIFSKVLFLPENSPETYEFGLVTNIPWLYYWIMGKLLILNQFGFADLLVLRLFNIPLAFATVFFVWRTLRLLTADRLSQILLIVAMTNTIMFTFLSSFVSYDNLTNLLAAMSVYYLLAFFKTRSGDLLAASFLCQLAGSLTKLSFLPLTLILSCLLLAHELKNLRGLPGALAGWFKGINWRRAALALGILLFLGLNIQLFGGNYYRYGAVDPSMSQVLSLEKAMENRLQARTEIFTMFKEGKISREQALFMASRINQPNDRAEAIHLIENHIALMNGSIKQVKPMEYAVLWVQRMSAGVFGIFAHLMMPNNGPVRRLFAPLIALTILSIVVRWRPRAEEWLPTCLLIIAVLYGLFLMYYVNYRDYLFHSILGLGLQGRYIFPVLGTIYTASAFYLLRLFGNGRLRLAVWAVASLIFIASDFPFFLRHVTPEWFIPLFD